MNTHLVKCENLKILMLTVILRRFIFQTTQFASILEVYDVTSLQSVYLQHHHGGAAVTVVDRITSLSSYAY